jgi:transposase-like protein
MDIKELRKQYPDEASCRSFFESIIWSSGRTCPHCESGKSWAIKGQSARDGLYECGSCGLQFTVTTKTPMHSTKLPLLTWLTTMYLIANSSKGISSVVLGACRTGAVACPQLLLNVVLGCANFIAPASSGVINSSQSRVLAC